jgi:hypothetical protein
VSDLLALSPFTSTLGSTTTEAGHGAGHFCQLDDVGTDSRYRRYSLRRLLNARKAWSFASLPEEWNGPGTGPVPRAVVGRAVRLIDALPIQPLDIFPTGRGTVQIEFDRKNRSLEIEIGSSRIDYLLAAGDDYEEWSSEDDASVNTVVMRFHGSQPRTATL